MSDTTHLALPYLAASQAQKHVTHNEALTLLDGLVQAAVKSRALATPPGSPAEGDRYLVAAAPTGAWAGQSGRLAYHMDGAWRFFVPQEGWTLWVDDEDVLLSFNGTSWNGTGAPTELQNLTLLGVNATADITNKFALSSAASLFNHAGAGHQIKLNKNAAADTISLLYQTGFSGRAEIGLAGDDNLHVKVSADGSTYHEALVVDGADGRVTIKKPLRIEPMAGDPASPQDGQLWYNSTSNRFRKRQNGVTSDLDAAGGGLADGGYGDITASGGGTTLTIDNAAVTLGKLQTINEARVLGRVSSGSGAVEELTGQQLRNMIEGTLVLAADNTVSTTAFADVTGMSFTGEADSTYIVEIAGTFQTAATTTGIGLAFDIPSGAVSGQILAPTSTTAPANILQTGDDAVLSPSTGVAAANTNYPLLGRTLIRIGATGGTVKLRQRSEIASSNTVLKAGSAASAGTVMTWKKVA